MRLSLRPALGAVLLLAAGTAACRRSAPKGTESEPPIPVVTEAVQLGSIRGVVSATAVVEALPGADFSAIAPVQADRLHNPGDLVGTSTTDVIIRVIDPRQVEVVASVPVADAGRFADGASARGVTTTRPAPEPLRVVARAQPEAGATAVPVRLAFLEPTALTAGTELGIEIDAEQRSNVPLVPAIAVVKDGGTSSVFVAAGTQARKRQVVLGVQDAERVEIRSGLKAGELIVTQGQSNLRDGSAISISQ